MVQISYVKIRMSNMPIEHLSWYCYTLVIMVIRRRWVLKFDPTIARNLRQRRPRPSDRWHLDEMVVRIAGKHMYLWRAVDHEGEVHKLGSYRAAFRHLGLTCSTSRA